MLLVVLAICWLFGIWLAAQSPPGLTLFGIAGLLSLLGALYYGRQRDQTAGLLLAGLLAFCAGALRNAGPLSPCLQANPAAIPADLLCHHNDWPRRVTVYGTVVATPQLLDRTQRVRVASRAIQRPDEVLQAVTGDVQITAWRYLPLSVGMPVTVTGQLATPLVRADYDERALLARDAVFSTMYLPQIDTGPAVAGNFAAARLQQLRADLLAAIDRAVPAPSAALLRALLIGDAGDLSAEVRAAFRASGLTHILVVSGYHVALLLLVTYQAAGALLRPRAAALLALGVLLGYGALVGWQPPVVRAVLMGAAYLLGIVVLGRRSYTPAVLAAVAIGMTAYNPHWLWSVSFQLSTAATLGILLWAEPLAGWTARRLAVLPAGAARRVLTAGAQIVTVTLAAQLLTWPLLAYHFGELSTIGVLANVLVLPLQPLILIGGAGVALLGLIAPPLAQLGGWLLALPLAYTLAIADALARLPGASVPLTFSPYALLAYFALAAAVAGWDALPAEQRRVLTRRLRAVAPLRIAAAGVTLAAIALLALVLQRPDGRLHITFFDVGQGDAILIETPEGHQVLVDTGQYPARLLDQLGRALPAWDRDLDLLIATHPDQDHVLALPDVLRRYRVGQLLTNGELGDAGDLSDVIATAVAARGVAQVAVQAGQTIALGGVTIEVLHPGLARDAQNRNNNSVVVRIVYGDFACLLTGDAEADVENTLLASGRPLRAQVLKAGHHGAANASGAPLLAAVQPQVVVISAGADNRYGHPDPAVLARAAAAGAAVLSTAEHGTLRVTTDGRQMWWQARR